MKDTNSTFLLLLLTCLVEYTLAKGFFIIEHKSNNLSSVPNGEKKNQGDQYACFRLCYILLHRNDLCCKLQK